jgi:hypothetical protein
MSAKNRGTVVNGHLKLECRRIGLSVPIGIEGSASTAAGTLDSQIASLATIPSDVHGFASGVLSVLEPTKS